MEQAQGAPAQQGSNRGAPEQQGGGPGDAQGHQHQPTPDSSLVAARAGLTSTDQPAENSSLPPHTHSMPHQDWQPSANVESAREALRHVQRFLLDLRNKEVTTPLDSRARTFQAPLCDLDAVLSNMATQRGPSTGVPRS